MFILHLTLFKFKKIHDLLAFDFNPVPCWTSTCSDRLMAIATTTCRRTIMNRRNDHQNPHRPKTTWAGQLVCPHCQTAFPLTWRRYWSAPMGNYRCLESKKISYAKSNSFWLYPIIIGAALLGGIVAVILSSYFSHNVLIAMLFFAIGGLFIGIPLDRWVDGHLRRLEPREAKQ